MGEREKNCCITGSTEAATDVVDNATFLKTLTAIQSLCSMSKHKQRDTRMHILEEQFQDLEGAEGGVAPDCLGNKISMQTMTTSGENAHEVPHDLAGDVSPANEDAARTQGASVVARTNSLLHQSLGTLVSPRHHFSNWLVALRQRVHHSDKLDLEKLHEILVATVAHQGGLVPDRFEVHFLP